MNQTSVSLLVWGDFACFTRPEMKVERVSYPILTPSAARGVLEAILWEPQFYYVIQEISVVEHRVRDGTIYGKGQWVSFRRNEVQSVIKMDSAAGWMRGTQAISYIIGGGGAEESTQRKTLALQRVAYLITAQIHLSALAKPPRDNHQKYYERFRRRAITGKCHHYPCLGCREFAADFEWCENPDALVRVNWDEDLGIMLYDIFAPQLRSDGFAWYHDGLELPEPYDAVKCKQAAKNGFVGEKLVPKAMFFRACIRQGKMECNPETAQIYHPQGGR